jgi:threonine-phosphate decarboxylase
MYLKHGGDIYSSFLKDGGRLLDFSSNINPLGLPQSVIEAVCGEAANFAAYPDPLCRRLTTALAEHHGIDGARIVCGNGAADLIYRIVGHCKPRRALVTAPTFSEYEKALTEALCPVDRYNLRYPHFQVDEAMLSALEGMDMLFLCNPNNPTGILIPPPVLEGIVKKCEETGTLLIVDECFNDFLDEGGARSVKRFLDTSPHLVILNAFTKTHAMAGLRLGYILCGSARTAEGVADTGQSWSVSQAAQVAGIAALGEGAYVEEARRLIHRERNMMKEALSGAGLEVLGGEANYIFFRLGETFRRESFFQDMMDRGILLRSCANYPGLDDSFFRIAIKKPEENRAFLDALGTLKK